MPITKPKPPAETASVDADRLDELERRVARLETLAGTRVRTQAEDDDEILSRQPNSYPEAVRYQEALERRKARQEKRDQSGTDAEAGGDS